MPVDSRSETNIATLNKKVQPLARKLIEEATAQGIYVKIISGHRTYEEQNELYAQGRTKPGKVVTKAKGGHRAITISRQPSISGFSIRMERNISMNHLTISEWE